MKNDQKRIIKRYTKLITWGAILLTLVIVGIYVLNVYNYCAHAEVDIMARQNEAKNQLSQVMTQVKGADKTLTREEQKLIEVMQIAITRYDKIDGAWAWIQEQNLQVSPESYQQVRQTLEIYYSKFYAQQTTLNDMMRGYDRKRASAVFGAVSDLLGFPTQKYLDTRPGQLILEDGVNETYDSEERTMPDIPMSSGKEKE